jgi:hypothetical protein
MIGTNPPKTGSMRDQMGQVSHLPEKTYARRQKAHRFRKVQSQAELGIKLKTDF